MDETRELTVRNSEETAPLMALVGRPSVIPGEDACSYNGLLARLTMAIRPKDFIEEIWVRDAADLVWDAFRLRRLKSELMAGGASEGLERVLIRLDCAKPLTLARQWAMREQTTVGEVEA